MDYDRDIPMGLVTYGIVARIAGCISNSAISWPTQIALLTSFFVEWLPANRMTPSGALLTSRCEIRVGC